MIEHSDNYVFGYIYLITNKIDGKQYVGQTRASPETRFKQHRYSNGLLGISIRENGFDNFELKVMDIADNIDELNEKEVDWIHKLDTLIPLGYNVSIGGGAHDKTEANGNYVPVINLNTQIIYESMTFAALRCNTSVTGIWRCCHSDAVTSGGYQWALLEDYENGTAVLKEKKTSGPEGVEVVHLNTGIIYGSAGIAERATGVPSPSIINICRGGRKSHKGTRWKYYDERKTVDIKSRGTRAIINLDTEQIYSTIKEAAASTSTSSSKIVLVCQGKRKSTGGFRWAYCDDHFWEGYIESVDTVAKSVINLDTDDVFDSVTKACLWCDGEDASVISRVCKGKFVKAYGYRWAYLDDYNKDGFKPTKYKHRKEVMNVDTGEIFATASEASRKYNISDVSIGKSCKNPGLRVCGTEWKYTGE